MYRIARVISLLLLLQCPVKGQEAAKQSIGFEFLGSAGLYSLVYTNRLLSAGSYAFEIRPQLSVIPGSESGGIPHHIAPFIGINNRLGKRMISLNVDVSAGIAFNWGSGHYKPQMISSVAVGPKLRTNFMTIGVCYIYFFQEPRFFSMKSFPHSFGVSFEAELGSD